MADASFGANEFTFTGDRTKITFYPVAPGPVPAGQPNGSLVQYEGIEGTFTFRGGDVLLAKSPLGTQVSVALEHIPDTGGISVTVLVPSVNGVEQDGPVTFETLAIKASSPGFQVPAPGASLTYSIVPLLATAADVILPL